MSVALGWLAAALYGFAALLVWRGLHGHDPTRTTLTRVLPAAIALVAHAASVALADGMTFAIGNALSLTAWGVVAILILLAFRHPVESLGVAVLPLAAAIVAIVPLLDSAHEASLDPGVWVHAMLSLGAYALLCLAAAQACLVAWHIARLRQAPGTGPSELPPLATMERLLFSLLAVGLVVLTAALVSGFAFLENMFAQQVAHKTVFSLLAWATFAALLVGHHIAGWRGKTAVRWTLAGLALLIVGFFGSKLVLDVVLAT